MSRLNSILFFTTFAVVGALTTSVAVAGDLAKPQGQVVLTVSGSISNKNDGDTAVFDLDMLRAMPSETYTTTTIWTEGVQELKGVPLIALLEELGADGDTLKTIAINDYAVDFPIDEVEPSRALLAYSNFGEPMSVRDKGPLWIVFPFDEGAEYQTEINYSRSIWQLSSIEVLKD